MVGRRGDSACSQAGGDSRNCRSSPRRNRGDPPGQVPKIAPVIPGRATGAQDGLVNLWSAPDGRFLRHVIKHEKAVRSVAFSADGKRIIVGGFKTSGDGDNSGDNLLYVITMK